jgi:NTP pyrophosphatase (non-canonical NTP hydrolase)
MNTLAQRAKAASDTYCALNAPDLPADPISALQLRLYRWEVTSFGYQDETKPTLGISEELGELAEAKTNDEILDAIADVGIYALQLATKLRLDAGVLIWEALENPADYRLDLPLPQAACAINGRISHVILKSSQGIRGMGSAAAVREAIAPELARLFRLLLDSLPPGGYLLMQVIFDTAEQVMKRVPKALPQVVR